MDSATKVALGAALLAALVSVTVPTMTFRLAMRQDQVRWLREQRALLYVDLLAEAYAEQSQLEYEMISDEGRRRLDQWREDTRLPPLERAKLGARGTMLGSRAVNSLFNEILRQAIWATMVPVDQAAAITAQARVAELVTQLQEQIRREIGTDSYRIGRDPVPSQSRQPVGPPAAASSSD